MSGSLSRPGIAKRLVLVLLVTAGVSFGGYVGFRAWPLRHSYEVYVSGGRTGKALFYSHRLLFGNKKTVRRWIKAEILRSREVPVDKVIRMDAQLMLLYMFREPEDVDILWRRAEMGFVVKPTRFSTIRRKEWLEEYASELSHALIRYLEWIYSERHGSREQGFKALEKELKERDLGPGMREYVEVVLKASRARCLARDWEGHA